MRVHSSKIRRYCAAGLAAGTAAALAAAMGAVRAADFHATDFQSIAQIEAIARAEGEHELFPLRSHERLKVGPIDARLRLRACAQALTAAVRSGTRLRDRVLVEVGCPDARGWRTFVPVRIVGTGTAVALARAAVAGQVLKAEDLKIVAEDPAQFPLGYFDDPAAAIGLTLNRSVAQNVILTNQQLVPSRGIVRGQEVQLLADVGGIKVRMTGRALGDAFINQRVKVQNGSSGRIVEGIARSADVVEINER